MSQSLEELEKLESRYKAIVQRVNSLSQDKLRIDAAQAENKRTLKNVMEECKKNNWDPDTIQEDIRRAMDVFKIKCDNLDADLDAAEAILRPMLKEIAG
jgi:archaellum component FlaC